MALSLQLGYPDIPKSITNPNVNKKDALDLDGPMPFLTFIKTISVSFEPDSLQNYYNFYIKTWNNLFKNKPTTDAELLVTKYKEFLKDISLNYTTLEEKKFLSKINFDDPLDLDIAIGFYSRKLKEVALQQNNKRNDIKYNVVRNKLRGTNFGTEKTIFELTLSYLKNLDDGKILYDYDLIKSNIEVEIEELYDTYPTYFNKTPDELEYDAKDLDFGYDLFLRTDADLLSSVFSGISQEIQDLKELDDIFENKRRITQKYISTDFYYLSTGSTTSQFISGRLLKADKPSSNFLNRDWPTTISKDYPDHLQTAREKGFFKPSNTSIILVDGRNSSFTFNLSNLSPNSLYYFPDPNIIGVNGDLLTFIVDDRFLKRNFSSGNAVDQPYSSPTDTKYYGYVSKTEPSPNKYLDTIFDSGFVSDSKKDIYNNLFGLFHDDFRFKKSVATVNEGTRLNLLINGYKLYDDVYDEGSAFNYFTADNTTYTETIRTGLSTTTGSFSSTKPDLTLFFGGFNPFIELKPPTEFITTYEILEGGFIKSSGGLDYADPISSDLSAFEVHPGPFYFSDLIESGLYDNDPVIRALLDPAYPSLTANATFNPRGLSIELTDGGYIEDLPEEGIIPIINNVAFDNTTLQTTSYTLSTPSALSYPDWNLKGRMFVRNAATREVKELLDAFPYLTSKYNSSIIAQLSSQVVKFEVVNDIMIKETPSYIIFNKILLQDRKFVDPKTVPISLEHSTTPFDRLSNRFKKDTGVFYCVLRRGPDSALSNDFIVYPEIYRFDLVNFQNELMFPYHSSQITSYFSLSGGDVRYTEAESPRLVYNSRNNIFSVSFLCKDQNNHFTIHEYDFTLNPDVTFLRHRKLNATEYAVSNVFDSGYNSNLSLFLSSGPSSTLLEELIL